MLNATLQFETGKPAYRGKGLWTMTKDFNDLRHLDNFVNYICRTKGYFLDEVYHNSGYPFAEGDTYFTIETMNPAEYNLLVSNGENPDKYVVIESVWDDVSEEIYDENKHHFYTWSRKQAERYAEMLNDGQIINLRTE